MQHFKKGIFFWIANLFTHPSNLNSVERDERVAKKKRLYFVYSFNLAFFADDKSLKAWKIRFLYIPNFSLYAKKSNSDGDDDDDGNDDGAETEMQKSQNIPILFLFRYFLFFPFFSLFFFQPKKSHLIWSLKLL